MMPVERPMLRMLLLTALAAGGIASGNAAAAPPTSPATTPVPAAAAAPAAVPAAAPSSDAKPLDPELLEFLAEFSDAEGFADPFVLDATVNRAAAEALDEQVKVEKENAAKANPPAAKAPQEDDHAR